MIKSWMVIGGVAIALAILSNVFLRPKGVKWFARLRRPRWLTFEKLIPIIWTIVFTCAAWSAYLVWEREPGTPKTWFMMGLYILLEVVTLSYNTVMLALRSLKVGVIIGGAGAILALLLAATVLPLSGLAAALLIPYLLWSPIGTYTTWEMMHLNPADV
ncbi:tryptophan-rich sensory protein [Oscillatoria sp. FACHB-1407]|uniref:TspO/MBR family protein n=1 Tax=Oscillatoria sp. FACHB-1407 TaxID=2692847 RepID=UPI00168689D0|nr:tryptophan-rich sensory protein [Oscillatoria sp. FACHB-1407]MBD2464710.1 tryptophan-rich sensory protein [Oscillatoria sp. FACHB-1407]